MRIPIEYIIELGLLRKQDKCAMCGNIIKITDYHIQLCKKCRLKYLYEETKW